MQNPTLKETLEFLYHQEGLSIRQLVMLTDDKCTTTSLRTKMRELGISLRKRGGPNYTKPFEITKEEYKSKSYKEMAFEHNVNVTTIRNRCKKFIKENGKKRRQIKD